MTGRFGSTSPSASCRHQQSLRGLDWTQARNKCWAVTNEVHCSGESARPRKYSAECRMLGEETRGAENGTGGSLHACRQTSSLPPCYIVTAERAQQGLLGKLQRGWIGS